MNIQGKINKLLMAFKQKGYYIKVNTEQFYNEENKLMTKYIVYDTHPKKGEVFYSKVKMLLYLVELYKRVGGENG